MLARFLLRTNRLQRSQLCINNNSEEEIGKRSIQEVKLFLALISSQFNLAVNLWSKSLEESLPKGCQMYKLKVMETLVQPMLIYFDELNKSTKTPKQKSTVVRWVYIAFDEEGIWSHTWKNLAEVLAIWIWNWSRDNGQCNGTWKGDIRRQNGGEKSDRGRWDSAHIRFGELLRWLLPRRSMPTGEDPPIYRLCGVVRRWWQKRYLSVAKVTYFTAMLTLIV